MYSQIEIQNMFIHNMFEAQAKKTPNAIAVIFEKRKLTYSELNIKSNQLAHYLRDLNVGPEILVGICLERSLEMIIGLLGVLKAGGAYVPIDPMLPKERLSFIFSDSQISILLTNKKISNFLPAHEAHTIYLDSDIDKISKKRETNLVNTVKKENLCYVIYTSGTTGIPKGVLITHKGLPSLSLAQRELFDIKQGSRVLQYASLSYDVSVWEIFMALPSGGTVCLINKDIMFSVCKLIHFLNEEKITHAMFPPSVLSILPYDDLPFLRFLMIGGESYSISLVKKWQKKTRRFFNIYGPTETPVCTTVAECLATDKKIFLGNPIADIKIEILNSDLQPISKGSSGELYIHNDIDTVRGYLNRPDLTKEKFIQNNLNKRKRLYRTGDLVYYHLDGNIEYLGRIDNQIKINSIRIEIEEVENILSEHPAICQAVVILRKEGDEKHLIAYVILKQKNVASISAIRSFLKRRLPAHMIPSAFVILDAIPLTPNGKIDRRALPAPDPARRELDEKIVPPRTPVEEFLVSLWSDLLKLEQIGIYDNFFDLGGNSLLAMLLLNKVEKKFGKKVPLTQLFRGQTIAQQAEIIQEQAKQSSVLVALQSEGSRPPFFYIPPAGSTALNGANFVQYLGIDQPFYGLQPLGFEEGEIPHDRIEDMAAYYIKEIQTVQPEGAYCLGGPCFGAYVAFEMAQQLNAQGCTVALLAMFDPGPPCRPASALSDRFSEFLHYIRQAAEFAQRGQLIHGVTEFVHDRLAPKIRMQFSRDHDLIRIRNMMDAHQTALETYKPQPYPRKITLFRSSQYHAHEQTGKGIWARRWSEFAAEIDLRVIEGTHNEIFAEPRIQQFAAQLKQCLEEARRLHCADETAVPMQ